MASQIESIKWIPGTRLMVDAFNFTNSRCRHYFLTHCHSDHTTGLTRSFSAGTIWCSPVSARLLAAEYGLHAPCVRQLHLGQPVVIDGVRVTAIDANHCPGAIMLLFEVPQQQQEQQQVHGSFSSSSSPAAAAATAAATTNVLHTGDCRWHDGLRSGSCLAQTRVDVLMLDTTYSLEKHTFPPQEEAIAMMVQVIQEQLQADPRTLFVCSSYHIGKERAYLGAAAAAGLRVYCSAAKQRTLRMLDLLPQQLALLSDCASAQLHAGCCRGVSPPELQTYLHKQQREQAVAGIPPERRWTRVVGFRATGWTYRKTWIAAGGGPSVQRLGEDVAVYGIPYSEHSSWTELCDCVRALRPRRLVPTVNAGKQSEAIVNRFAHLMDLRRDRGRMDAYLLPAAAAPAPAPAAAGAAAAAGTSSSPQRSSSGCSSGEQAAAAVAAEAAACCDQQEQHSPPSTSPGPLDVQQQQHAAATAAPHHSGVEGSLGDVAPVRGADQGQVPTQQQLHERQQEQQQQEEGASPAADGIDLSDIDLAEQQRLLEEAARVVRLRRSVELRQAKKKAAAAAAAGSSRGGVRKRRLASTPSSSSRGASKQQRRKEAA